MAVKFLRSEQWRALIKGDELPDQGIVKEYIGDPKPLTDEVAKSLDLDPKKAERSIVFTVSTEARDRDNDRIMQDGWNLKQFRKNPVVPWAHDYSTPPVGRAIKIWGDVHGHVGKRLRMVKQFTPQDVNPFGHMIFRMVEEGFLKAASVGFIPTRAIEDKNSPKDIMGRHGFVFEKQELLESSIVPVPSNPQALSGAKSIGIDIGPLINWAELILDGDPEADTAGVYIPRSTIEEARTMAKGKNFSIVVGNTTGMPAETWTDTGTYITVDGTAGSEIIRSLNTDTAQSFYFEDLGDRTVTELDEQIETNEGDEVVAEPEAKNLAILGELAALREAIESLNEKIADFEDDEEDDDKDDEDNQSSETVEVKGEDPKPSFDLNLILAGFSADLEEN